MVQGSLIGVIGTVLGVVGGIAADAQPRAHPQAASSRCSASQLLPADVYYITGLPTDLQAGDVGMIALVALAMAFSPRCTRPGARRAPHPAEALRYE